MNRPLIALTLLATSLAASPLAQARGGPGPGGILAAGILGLAVGHALAGPRYHHPAPAYYGYRDGYTTYVPVQRHAYPYTYAEPYTYYYYDAGPNQYERLHNQ